MGGFDAIPSIQTILAQAQIWANPLIQEFSWTIGVTVSIAVLVGVCYFIYDRIYDMFAKIFGLDDDDYFNNTWNKETTAISNGRGKLIRSIEKNRGFRDGLDDWKFHL